MKTGWTRDKIDQELLPVIRKMTQKNEERQTLLDAYFIISPSKKSGAHPSERVRSVVDKLRNQKNSTVSSKRGKQKTQIPARKKTTNPKLNPKKKPAPKNPAITGLFAEMDEDESSSSGSSSS